MEQPCVFWLQCEISWDAQMYDWNATVAVWRLWLRLMILKHDVIVIGYAGDQSDSCRKIAKILVEVPPPHVKKLLLDLHLMCRVGR